MYLQDGRGVGRLAGPAGGGELPQHGGERSLSLSLSLSPKGPCTCRMDVALGAGVGPPVVVNCPSTEESGPHTGSLPRGLCVVRGVALGGAEDPLRGA